MTEQITIRKPDDWHVHIRDGGMMRAVFCPYGRTLLAGYPHAQPRAADRNDRRRDRLFQPGARSAARRINIGPLLTCYLREDTDPDDVERGFREGVFAAVKLYPAHATTNAAVGVGDIAKVRGVFARLEEIGMPLLIHGEEVDPSVDIFDREAVFVERRLTPLLKDFPGLKVVLEHLSTRLAVDFVRAHAPQLAGTITPHHLAKNRTDWLGHGNRPNLYCMPVIKEEADRLALVAAATSGEACFFLGTDSAPHSAARKLAPIGAAGVFSAPVALEAYAEIFAAEGRLDRLEAFASLNGPRHYGLPVNTASITLVRSDWVAPEEVPVDGPEERVMVYRGGETIPWKIAN